MASEQIHSHTAPGMEQEPSSLVSEQMPLLAALGTASQIGDFVFDVLAFFVIDLLRLIDDAIEC